MGVRSEIERAVIGALLLDSALASHRLIAGLSRVSFESAEHGRLFEAIGAIVARGDAVSPLSVCLEIGGGEDMQEFWLEEMRACVEACPTAVDGPWLIATLREAAAADGLRAVCREAAAMAENPKRIWDAGNLLWREIQHLKGLKKQLSAFPSPHPIRAETSNGGSPRE